MGSRRRQRSITALASSVLHRVVPRLPESHIPNREAVLDEAFRVLESRGRVVTMIPPTLSRVWHALRAPWDNDQHERGMVEGEVFRLTSREVRRLVGDDRSDLRPSPC
jgi:ubiquinone/menaquinone biosynthesis C-methylase UbiE